MKANSLRIGNWAMYSSLMQVNANKIRECDEHPDRFSPVKIMEEWLKSLGFEIKKGAWGTSAEIRVGRVRYVLYQNGNVWSINPTDGFRVDFKYRHTLQNHYFALFGQEL